MGVVLFNVKLEVEIVENKLKATLLFKNDMPQRIYLDGMTLCWKNKVQRDVFKIKDIENTDVDYIGAMLQRVLVPESFLPIDSGEQFEANAILNEVYDIKKGQRYFVQYYAYNPSSFDPDDDTLIRMESNIVEVAY